MLFTLLAFTASLNDFPNENVGTVAAGTVIFSLVLGLLTSRSVRSFESKLPNPTSETLCPSHTESTMTSSVEESTSAAVFLETPAFCATASTNAGFVTCCGLLRDIRGMPASTRRCNIWFRCRPLIRRLSITTCPVLLHGGDEEQRRSGACGSGANVKQPVTLQSNITTPSFMGRSCVLFKHGDGSMR